MILLLQIAARLISFINRTLNWGTGTTWSGEIALILDSRILPKLISPSSEVVLVAGTNGKTTTAKMVHEVLSKRNRVIANDTGANILNGFVGTVLLQMPLFFKSKKPLSYIFEVDESYLPILLESTTPTVLVLLNLFRDQLDRYGEVNAIAEKWLTALQSVNLTKTTLIVNGDDPQLAFLGKQLETKASQVLYFGLDDKKASTEGLSHATDSIFCPVCQAKLIFKEIFLSHLGNWHCQNCGFSHPNLDVSKDDFTSPLLGTYNRYNALSAGLVLKTLGFENQKIQEGLDNFTPAFGRQETIESEGREVKILLSKNPTGLNESLKTSAQNTKNILLVLNDRIPDGQDVSWIWDVDFELIASKFHKIFISGDRVFDLAARLKYAGFSEKTTIFENLSEATKALVNSVAVKESVWILPTYSAMLEVRQILTGRQIL